MCWKVQGAWPWQPCPVPADRGEHPAAGPGHTPTKDQSRAAQSPTESDILLRLPPDPEPQPHCSSKRIQWQLGAYLSLKPRSHASPLLSNYCKVFFVFVFFYLSTTKLSVLFWKCLHLKETENDAGPWGKKEGRMCLTDAAFSALFFLSFFNLLGTGTWASHLRKLLLYTIQKI